MDRKSLRKKIQTLLKDADLPGVGKDVLTMTSIPSSIENLPVILLYPKNETIDRFDESPKRYRRSLDIIIEIKTMHDTDELLTDEMDDLTSLVEDIIENDTTIEKEVEHIELKSVNFDTEGAGQSPIGSVKMTYEIDYITEPRIDPEFDSFDNLNATWKANAHESDDAQDEIDFNQ